METVWVVKECDLKQRTTVCSGVDKEAEQNVGNWDEVVNIVPSTNKWLNWKNKPGTRTIFIVFCWL